MGAGHTSRATRAQLGNGALISWAMDGLTTCCRQSTTIVPWTRCTCAERALKVTVVGTVEDAEPEETKNFDVRSQQREQNGITTEPGCGDFHLGRQVTLAGRLVPAILPKVDGCSRGARSCRDPAYLLCISADLDMHISSPMH